MNIENCICVVTGGASGLGEATARRLVTEGARVAILDVDQGKADQLARGIGVLPLHCDVTSESSVQQALRVVNDRLGPADLLVNCAGGGPARRIVGRDGPMPLEHFVKTVNLNLIGAFNVSRLVAADMMAKPPSSDGERGLIMFTSSIAAFDGQIGQSAYSSSKGALVSLTLQMAREFAQHGIRVMSIAPGIFNTPLLQGATQEVQAALAAAIPFPKRLGHPEEYADLVLHIARNTYLNGDVIRLDGAVRLGAK